MSPAEVARLRTLLAAASPAPWSVTAHYDPEINVDVCDADGNLVGPKDEALVAAMRNALPELLDALEEAREEERDRILRAVDRHVPANFQLGSLARVVRLAIARAAEVPIETASERGLAIAAARESGRQLGHHEAAEAVLAVPITREDEGEGEPLWLIAARAQEAAPAGFEWSRSVRAVRDSVVAAIRGLG